VAESLTQASLERVIGRIRDARDQATGGINARRAAWCRCAPRVEAPLVGIAGGRDWLAARGPRNVDRRIAFDEPWQMRSLGSHVSDLEEDILSEGTLNVQVPILRVGQRQIRAESQVGERSRKLAGDRRITVERVRHVEIER